jgi:acyl-CoA thioesterase
MSEQQTTAEKTGQWMVENDRFARLLGIELEAVSPGYCRVAMTTTGEMLNSVGIVHGGATFTLADFAFAVASNSHGQVAVALSAQMNYPSAGRLGDRLTAEAKEESKTGRTGLYTVEIRNGENALVGLFTGTVFRRSDNLSDWMQGERG